MVVRFPAGPQVSLKCGDQSKDNGAGHKKNVFCLCLVLFLGFVCLFLGALLGFLDERDSA